MNKNNSLPSIFRWTSFLSIILIWTLLSFFIDHRLFASPLSVLNDIWYHLSKGELIDDTLITLARAGSSFVIAMILGSIIGVQVGPDRRKLIDSYLNQNPLFEEPLGIEFLH